MNKSYSLALAAMMLTAVGATDVAQAQAPAQSQASENSGTTRSPFEACVIRAVGNPDYADVKMGVDGWKQDLSIHFPARFFFADTDTQPLDTELTVSPWEDGKTTIVTLRQEIPNNSSQISAMFKRDGDNLKAAPNARVMNGATKFVGETEYAKADWHIRMMFNAAAACTAFLAPQAPPPSPQAPSLPANGR
jgi:hypothetical protein